MPIQLPRFDRIQHPPPGEHGERLLDVIAVGRLVIKAQHTSRFFKDMRIKKAYSDILRQCHMTLGAGGNFKLGCLYREVGVDPTNMPTTCDHAVPITIIRDWIMAGSANFEDMAFSPVALISRQSDQKITQSGLAKKMPNGKSAQIMSRYFACEIKIQTHEGESVNENWSWEDHRKLIHKTKELEATISRVREVKSDLFTKFPWDRHQLSLRDPQSSSTGT